VELEPYSTLSNAEPIYATAAYPFFDLNDTTTTLQLQSKRETPIHLFNALAYGAGIYASFPFINTATEAYIAPHSLAFTPEGTHFIAGGTSMFAVFDVSRNGEEPVERHRTGNRSKGLKSMANVTGPKAIISTLDISCDNFLALGTYTREIGIYSNSGRGQSITAFNLMMTEPPSDPEPKGCGITQVKWSPCGRYLFVAERRSKGIGVWDIRGVGRRLAWLDGRDAMTNVQCGFDVVRAGESCEVWAGTADGKVKMWGNAGSREGVVDADAEWNVHDGKPSPCLSMSMQVFMRLTY
jgi:WD40 repeat protein